MKGERKLWKLMEMFTVVNTLTSSELTIRVRLVFTVVVTLLVRRSSSQEKDEENCENEHHEEKNERNGNDHCSRYLVVDLKRQRSVCHKRAAWVISLLRQYYLKMNHFVNETVFILHRDGKIFGIGNVCVDNVKHRPETGMVGRLGLVNWH